MGTISVTRRSNYFGFFRAVVIEVDGQEVGRLKRKETLEVDVPDGQRTVQALMDWIGSPPLTVDVLADTTLHLRVAIPNRPAMAATGRVPKFGDQKALARKNPGIDLYVA